METPAPPPLKPPLQTSSKPREKEPDDVQKLLQWQEERIRRKLSGEYESAVLHLSELINSNLSTPTHISSVRVEGAKNTRYSFLSFLINPLLPASSLSDSPNQSNLESVLHTTRRISHLLQQTGIFQSIEAKMERAQDVLAKDGDVDIIFKTREKGRFFLNTTTEIGNNEGNASATARIRNVFGGAETFEANISLGTKTRRSFHASLTAPLTPNLNTTGELTVFGLERDNTSYASCMEGLRGVKATVRNGARDRGMHELVYEAVLRHIGSLTPTASISMREAAGQTLKSSLSHTYTRDTRDDRITATRGYYTKLLQEFAGLGGDASHYKAEAEGQMSRPVVDGVTLSLAARTGLIYPLARPTLFSDRFQLGGPISLRSFKSNSMGPRDGSDALGGDIYWSAGLSLISNIPKKPHWPVKTHVWLNAGRLDAFHKSRTLSRNIQSTLTRPSVSAGVGIIYRFDPIRVEVNFGVPLVASRSDGSARGVQVGMGLEFL